MSEDNFHANSLPPFYVGQKVVVIKNGKSGGSSITAGQVFLVRGVHQCICGKWSIDVGLKTDTLGPCICADCDHNLGPVVLWCGAHGFRPLQSQTFPLMKYSEVRERELICEN